MSFFISFKNNVNLTYSTLKEKITFQKASDKTQKEIAELTIADKYDDNKLDPELVLETKSDFAELADNTQKEITELLVKDKYMPQETKEKTNEDFGLFRKMKIAEFLEEQERKMKKSMETPEEEQEQAEREFTDEKSLKFAFKTQEAGPIEKKVLKLDKGEFEDIQNVDNKKLINKIKDNEQKYMRKEASNQLKILKAVAELGSGYQVEFYES